MKTELALLTLLLLCVPAQVRSDLTDHFQRSSMVRVNNPDANSDAAPRTVKPDAGGFIAREYLAADPATLNSSVAALGSNAGTINVTSPLVIEGTIAIPGNITLKVSKTGFLRYPSGTSLKIGGLIVAPDDRQIFDGEGTIAIAGGVVSATWFSGSDIVAKIAAASNAFDSYKVGTPGTINVPDGDYNITTQVIVEPGKVLRLGRGTYTTDTGKLVPYVLKSDATLEGAGWETKIRENAGGRNWTTIGSYGQTVSNGTTNRNITVRNLQITAGRSDFYSGQRTITIGNVHGALLENLYLNGTHAQGLTIGGSAQYGTETVEIDSTVTKGRYAENVIVRKCVFNRVASQNLALVNGRNVTFEYNQFKDTGQLRGPGASPIDIEPNQADDIIQNVTIRSNEIDSKMASVFHSGILVQNTSKTRNYGPVNVTDNRIIGGEVNAGSKLTIGIYLRAASNVTVSHNYVQRSYADGIRLEGGSHSMISDNTLISCGGASKFSAIKLISSTDNRVVGNTIRADPNGVRGTIPRIIETDKSDRNVYDRNIMQLPPVLVGPSSKLLAGFNER